MEGMNFITQLAYGLGIAIVGMLLIFLPIFVFTKLIAVNFVLAIVCTLFAAIFSSIMLAQLRENGHEE